MNPTSIVNAWITSLVRLALALVGGYFIRKGIVDNDLWESTVAAIIGGVVMAFWSLFEKYKVKERIMLALKMPQGSSKELLDKVIATDVTVHPQDTKTDVAERVAKAEVAKENS
jgi:uncharacterized membrane protein